jgi:hypothetical protein
LLSLSKMRTESDFKFKKPERKEDKERKLEKENETSERDTKRSTNHQI